MTGVEGEGWLGWGWGVTGVGVTGVEGKGWLVWRVRGDWCEGDWCGGWGMTGVGVRGDWCGGDGCGGEGWLVWGENGEVEVDWHGCPKIITFRHDAVTYPVSARFFVIFNKGRNFVVCIHPLLQKYLMVRP